MLHREFTRNAIETLVSAARNDNFENMGLTLSDKEFLENVSPLEVERAVGRCHDFVEIRVDSLLRVLRRSRGDILMRKFVKGGASNELMRELFGLSVRELSRLRTETSTNTPSRQRRSLSDEEKRAVEARFEESPPLSSMLHIADWCLQLNAELKLPYMAMFRHAITLPGEEP